MTLATPFGGNVLQAEVRVNTNCATFGRHFEAEIVCWTAIWSTVAAWSGVPTVLVRRKASVSTASLWDSRRGVRNGQLQYAGLVGGQLHTREFVTSTLFQVSGLLGTTCMMWTVVFST